MKPDLLVVGALYEPTLDSLAQRYTLHRLDLAPDADALLASLAAKGLDAIATRGDFIVNRSLMQKLPGLRLIASYGVGYDGIDVDAARERQVAVTNTPDVLSECVADNTFALILSTVRRTVFNDRFVRTGQWQHHRAQLTDKVWGEKIGIVGLGRIGKAIARRAQAFRMDVSYHGRTRQADVPLRYYDRLVDMARDVKILVVVTPGGKGTERLVSREVIDALGPQGTLVNVSRGSTVDEACLVDALVNGRLAGAGLDVFQDEPHVPPALLALDNVVLQPHSSSATWPTRLAMGQVVLDNLAAHFAGQPLLTPVP